MTVILGPCPCQSCHQLVYWRPSRNGHKRAWRDENGLLHVCPGGVK